MIRTSALRALILAAACTACESSPFGFDVEATGSLVATVVRGPTSPVEHEGDWSYEPVQGARVSARPAFGGVTRDASTDFTGTARLRVPAGTWQVSVMTCPGALGTPVAQTVDVQAGAGAVVRFECDTGIR